MIQASKTPGAVELSGKELDAVLSILLAATEGMPELGKEIAKLGLAICQAAASVEQAEQVTSKSFNPSNGYL